MTHKHDVQEQLAGEVKAGVIVEIGGGMGHGALRMRGSTDRPIVVIDPFLPYKDRLGGEYGPATKQAFLLNTQGRNIGLLERTAEQAITDWRAPIGLLWLDISTTPEHLWSIIQLWAPFVIGRIAIAGLEWPVLEVSKIADRIETLGFRNVTDQNAVAVLEWTRHNRAVFYICSTGDNGRYISEAERSVKRVHEHLGLPVFLFLEGEWNGEIVGFDAVYHLPARSHKYWFLDSTRYFGLAMDELRDYGELLYLDVDTCICCDCMNIFTPLAKYDWAIGQSPQRDAIASAVGVPESFPALEVGVIAMRNTSRVRAFVADWLARYQANPELYSDDETGNDQGPLRDALYENDTIRWYALAPEWSLRFDFGAWVVGWVRILHGRVGGRSQPDPLDTCREINSRTWMRQWNHGLIPSSWEDEPK